MIKIFYVLILLVFSNIGIAREYIRVVGSSTLYPFITIAAERFGKSSNHTPVIEATGTGAGFHLFCSGKSLKYPDIINASRPIRKSEEELCINNGVTNIDHFILGYDGIILAQGKKSKKISLTKRDIFFALAKKVNIDGKIQPNPYSKWKEINPSLPNYKIEIYGPSFNSGTRDTLIELIMDEFCQHDISCKDIREDGAYIEMPENDNLIIHKLVLNRKAFGIISFNMLKENNKIKAINIDSISPTKENIVKSLYPLARPLFVYYNKDHAKYISQIEDFINELKSPESIGENGYLAQKGLLTKEKNE